MPPFELLIVEDDPDISSLLCRVLEKEGYKTTAAYSGSEGKLLLESRRFDMVLLDLMLPGMTGEELIKAIRATQTMPILILSAKTTLEDKVTLLRLGADDYITKPFEVGEVAARVEAQLRRYHTFSESRQEVGKRTFKGLTLEKEAMRVTVKGKELSLTGKEFQILSLFLENPDRVFTREALYRKVWGEEYVGEDNTVSVHISNIRQKIAKEDPDQEYIKTVWGIGFKLAN